MPTIACLLVPDLPLAVEVAARPVLAEQPVVIANEGRVVSVSAQAGERHVRAGHSVREAVALVPTLAVVDLRAARVAQAAEALAEALSAVSPLVECAAPGEIYADLRGLESLYPRPGMVEQAIFAGTTEDLRPQLGIAPTRFGALVAARMATPGTAWHIKADEQVALLADVPAAWLPLPPESLERLERFGVHNCSDLAAMPRHAVEAQFGPAGGRAWLAAGGHDPLPVQPRAYATERVVEHVQAQPPLVSRETIVRSAEQLLSRALRQPCTTNRLVRSLHLRAESDDEQLWERTQLLKEPTGDRARLWTALRTQLDYAEFPGPIAHLELELGGLTSESGRQQSLFREQALRREYLDEMVRHLKVRYGRSPIGRVVEVEPWSRIPERRRVLMDYDP